jgi:hypothetical protein
MQSNQNQIVDCFTNIPQKWIENINSIYPMDIKNVWYQGENEYGPESEEAGCYYKMLTSDKNVTVETWCGS